MKKGTRTSHGQGLVYACEDLRGELGYACHGVVGVRVSLMSSSSMLENQYCLSRIEGRDGFSVDRLFSSLGEIFIIRDFYCIHIRSIE